MKSTDLATRIRLDCLQITHDVKCSHIGSCLSCADIIAVLYASVMRYRPSEPGWPLRDRFILSKGHSALALYVTLAELGFFPREWLQTFYTDAHYLLGHVHHQVPGIELSTGSLGHGLPVGVGMALACQRQQIDSRVFVLMGDSECDEGSIYEGFRLSARTLLPNLTVIVDVNGLGALGHSSGFRSELWAATGWNTWVVDGHDHEKLKHAISARPKIEDFPTLIAAHTVKGKGVPFMENRVEWHYKQCDNNQLQLALAEVRANA